MSDTPLPDRAGAVSGPAQPATAPMRLVISSVAILLLLAALDQTVVATALPTIVADLGGIEHLSWVVTAYILASTVVAPLYGKLGDLYGRRRMVFISVGLFLAGSLLCGIAGTMEFLIFARAVQGLGGGGLFVLALSVVGDVVPPRERGKVQGVFAAVFSLSSMAGPLVGGWFVQVASWHWIFLVNVPLGVLAVVLFAASFAAQPTTARHRIDWAGAALLTVALAALTLVTSLGGRSFAWESATALGLIALVLAATAGFVAVEAKAEEPILPLGLFRSNVFRNTSALGFLSGAAMFGALTFLPVYLQIARGVTPLVSGLLLVPMTLGIVLAANVSGRYMGRTGRYKVLPAFGMAAIAVAAGGLSFLSAEEPLWLFTANIVLFGLGLGGIFPVVMTAVQNSVPRANLGTATASSVMFRQIGGSLGVAAFGALFAATLAAAGGAAMVPGAEFGPQAMAGLDAESRAALAGGVVEAIRPIFAIIAAMAVAGVVFALTLEEIPLLNRKVPEGE